MISNHIRRKKTSASSYRITLIDAVARSYSYGRALNNDDQVVGDSYLNSGAQQHAFLFHKETNTALSPYFGELHSVANAINNHGLIAGSHAIQTAPFEKRYDQAFMFDTANARRVDLGTLGGKSSVAHDINDYNQIVGSSQCTDNTEHAFLYDSKKNNAILDLGTLGGLNSSAYGINALGQVVGYSSINAMDTHAFIYDNGIMQSLNTLGGSCSFAYAINDYGVVVGSAYDSHDNEHAFLYHASNRPCMKDLGTLGGLVSVANDVNNHEQIVGYSFLSDNTDAHAFLYEQGVMTDLNQLLDPNTINNGWTLHEALAINDNGTIVGIAKNFKQEIPSCAFLMSVDVKANKSFIKFLTSIGLA